MTAYDTLRTAAATVAEDQTAPPEALNLAGQILDAIAILELAAGTAPEPVQTPTEEAPATTPGVAADAGQQEATPTPAADPTPATPTPTAGAAESDSVTSASTASGTAAADPAPVDQPDVTDAQDAQADQVVGDPYGITPTTVDHTPTSSSDGTEQ